MEKSDGQTQLKLGKMTMRELSTWFGLKPDSLSKHPNAKEKRLKALAGYANYHFEGKTLIIDQIFILEFNTAYDLVGKEFLKYWGKGRSAAREQLNIDTCTYVAKAIYKAHPEIHHQVKESTFIAYTQRYKREGWGKNGLADGPKGYSNYIYMNKEKDEPLKGEELEKFNDCLSRIFDGSWQNDQILGLLEDYHQKNISVAEFKDSMFELATSKLDWWKIHDIIEDELGYYPKKETQLVHNAVRIQKQPYNF